MKVLQVITRLDLGGSSRVFLDFIDILKNNGYDVYAISGKTRNKDLEKAVKRLENIKFFYIKSLVRDINILKDIYALFKLISVIKKVKPGILHLHSSKAGFLGRLAGLFLGVKKIVYTSHGHVFRGYFSRFKSYFFLFLEKLLFPFTTKMVSLTEKEIEDWVEFGFNRKKFYVIHNGIRIKDYERRGLDKMRARERINIPPHKKVILCIARLEYVKGVDILLESVNLIKKREDFVLVIVGDGSMREDLESFVRKESLEDKVIFLGEREDIPELISCSDFLVLPSRMEGLGISVLEGYVFNKPAIGFNVGGIPEVIKDKITGLIVEKENVLKLKEAILYFLDNEERVIEMGKNARIYLEEEFSYQKMKDNLLKLYSEILK